MTRYICLRCNTQMRIVEENVKKYIQTIKCPKCKIEIIVDKKDDIG